MNDHQIVEALRNRTVNGLTGIYDAYAQPLYAYCWSLLGDEGAAQEALTDSFIVAEAHVDKLADPGRLGVWLYTIARTECQRRLAGSTGPDVGPGSAAGHATSPAAGAPEETATGPSVGIDELLSGGSSPPPATDKPAGSSMMMAPGVLGVPGGSAAPADESSAESSAEPAPGTADMTAIPSDDRGETDAEPADDTGRPARDEPDTGATGIASALHTPTDRTSGDGRAEPEDAEGAAARHRGPATGQAEGPGDTDADDGEGSTAAERVLGGLPAHEREVLELTYRHSLATADVATVTGLAAQQVQSIHAHADQQIRSGLAVERLATGGRLGPPELAARLDGGEPPPAALVLSMRPPTLPDDFQPAVIGNFTSAEKIGYRLHVGGRAGPFDKAGFPVPPTHVGAGGGARPAGGSGARAWRWPAAGVGVAACLAGVLAAVILWPTGNTEHARSAAAPGAQTTDFGAPGVPAAPSITVSATPTPSETPPATPTSSPSPPPDGQQPGGTGNGGGNGGTGTGNGGTGGGGGNGGGGDDDSPPPDPPTTGPPPTWSTTEPDPDPFP